MARRAVRGAATVPVSPITFSEASKGSAERPRPPRQEGGPLDNWKRAETGLAPHAQNDMGGSASTCDVFHTRVAQSAQIDSAQQMLAGTEQDGRDGQVPPGG